MHWGDFPGSPVVKTLPSNAGRVGLIPGQGARIPQASRPKSQNVKQKQYCNKFNKDFKNGPHQKKKNALGKICVTCLIVIFTLLRWSGTKPTLSPKYGFIVKTQSNLQIQCNPYQITNSIFH